jgi:hypothetical protein
MFKLINPVYAQTAEWKFINPNCITDNDVATIKGFECLFFNIVRILTTVAGLAFFFMLIAGGFKMIFSGGDPKNTASARSTITSALIGLIISIAAWFILNFVEVFTGVQVTQFDIPS